VFEEPEGDLEALLDQFLVERGRLEQVFGVALFVGELVLALFEVGDREGAVEVGVDQLFAPVLRSGGGAVSGSPGGFCCWRGARPCPRGSCGGCV
jgi:hypothetical protein